MNGGRAERNEYILLHEFHRLKYICPDKTFGKKPQRPDPEFDEEGEGGGAKAGKNKRDKYKGGLVLPPKRGLWDKYILVMDFNSLYPSIIQEYNIDFTTVDRSDGVGDHPWTLRRNAYPSIRMRTTRYQIRQVLKYPRAFYLGSSQPWCSDVGRLNP